ncbi:MAG: FkbM family methyltransferase [Kastovskya adunca ATA6-11-RM4]|jgi:FkbM family methyltransferase|nr:FkbM family methyltransferase [Kastovskya adunca ATA6-11-RM4]
MAIKSRLKHFGKLLVQPEYRKHHFTLQNIKKLPRYIPSSTTLFEREFELVDSASFLFMYKEIFKEQIYRFKAQNENPLIIDGGANIGLSILYFKQLYSDSHIIAFEPDVQVFSTLERNTHGISNLELVNKAIWNTETELEFMAEGADGGRIIKIEAEEKKYKVKTVRLRKYLDKPVDLLKLDIEGAETAVIQDCQDLLHNVQNLFVEYHSFVDEPQTLHIIVNILSAAGFRIHIHPPVTSPQPFYHRNVHMGMDMQLNVFAFRE